MSTFSAEQLAQILHPQELEILEEIALEFEDPDENFADHSKEDDLSLIHI